MRECKLPVKFDGRSGNKESNSRFLSPLRVRQRLERRKADRARRAGRVIESGMEKSKIPVYCQHCKLKQIVHVFVRLGRSPMNNQTVKCITCKKEFDVLVSDPIIGGPFPE